MFKRLIITLLFLSFSAQAASLFEIDDTSAKASADGAKIGDSAVIIHHFSNNASIIARAKVVALNNDVATLEFFTFSDIAQNGMPVPVILPSIGDEVKYNYLYENALLLAPNKSSYEQLSATIKANLLDPELLASAIYAQDKLMPTRNDLRTFCADWGAGRIFLAAENHLKEYDCALLKLRSIKDISAQNTAQELNFYSAIAKPTGNFYQYFEGLLYQE